ncbi:hypothetical protein LV779_21930 [Streptomyces thinghirensis]|nr:hypothetical protein [Streptomyces thinghirensis]
MVSRLTRELGRPVRILKVLGLRSDEGADRKKRPAFRTVQANSARILDEWLPVKDWTTDAVKEWHADAPVPSCWTYDSVPGAGDWLGTSRCSCSLCVFASRRDLLLTIGRRPRLAALYAEAERDAWRQLPPGLADHRPDPARRTLRGPRPRHRLPGRRTGLHRPADAGPPGTEARTAQEAGAGPPRRPCPVRRLHRSPLTRPTIPPEGHTADDDDHAAPPRPGRGRPGPPRRRPDAAPARSQ